MFVDETRVQVFHTGDQILLLIFGNFLKFFFCFVSFIFDKLVPFKHMFQKML